MFATLSVGGLAVVPAQAPERTWLGGVILRIEGGSGFPLNGWLSDGWMFDGKRQDLTPTAGVVASGVLVHLVMLIDDAQVGDAVFQREAGLVGIVGGDVQRPHRNAQPFASG